MAIIFGDAKESLDIFIDKHVDSIFFEVELEHDRIEQGLVLNEDYPLDHQYMIMFRVFKDPFVDFL